MLRVNILIFLAVVITETIRKKKSYVNLEYMSDKVKYLRFICYLLFYVRRLGEAGQ